MNTFYRILWNKIKQHVILPSKWFPVFMWCSLISKENQELKFKSSPILRWKKKKKMTHSFFRVFMFQSCKLPSEKPTASWLVRGMYCRAVAPTPLAPQSCRQRCLPCLVLTSLSLGISPGDLVTTCRSAGKNEDEEQDALDKVRGLTPRATTLNLYHGFPTQRVMTEVCFQLPNLDNLGSQQH